MEIDINGWNEGNLSMKQKAFCVLLKNRLYELMSSNTQLIKQAILNYVDSVDTLWHIVTHRLCRHIVSACSILAKSQYRKCHDKVGTNVHWLLYKKYHLQYREKWYTHTPHSVQENDKNKIFWDFNIQTDKVIEHRRPDKTCINKQKRECPIIDFAISRDQNIAVKEQEKIDKYQDLRIEL